jgi:hypothetical protein
MNELYTLKAKRDPTRPETLTIRYPTKDLALAAATIIRNQGATVTVIGPGGLCLVEEHKNQDI